MDGYNTCIYTSITLGQIIRIRVCFNQNGLYMAWRNLIENNFVYALIMSLLFRLKLKHLSEISFACVLYAVLMYGLNFPVSQGDKC